MSTIDKVMEDIQDPEKALKLIKRVVQTHKSDPDMMDYDFFEEQAGFALHAVDALALSKRKLSEEEKELVDYCNNKIRPYFT